MGQKLCVGSSDTPLVTLDCTVINVTRSPNANVDITDSPLSEQQEEEKDPRYRRCSCLLWRRRQHKNEKGETKVKKENQAEIPST
jgi:hypothetical protein